MAKMGWAGVLACTTLMLVGCSAGTPAGDDAPALPPDAAPASPRMALLDRLRDIDECALFDGAGTVAGYRLNVVGPLQFGRCTAELGDRITVALSVDAATASAPVEQPGTTRVKIAGVDVSYPPTRALPDSAEPVISTTVGCPVLARYPDGTRLTAYVLAPAEVDGCSIGQALMPTAIHALADRPSRDDSDFPATVLTGADPCAPVQTLADEHRSGVSIELNTDETDVSTCVFDLDDTPMVVSLDYADPVPTEQDGTEINGHPVLGEASHGLLTVVVGPEFSLGGQSRRPEVSVYDETGDADRLMLVAGAVAEHY